jgi:hypothetical protein
MIRTQSKFLPLQFFLVLSICFLSQRTLAQQDSVTDVMQTRPHEWMKKLAWLEGSWEGEGSVPDGGKYSSFMTYTLDLNGHILRHQYEATQSGKIVWRDQGMMAYNSDFSKVLGTTIGIDGTYGHGEIEVTDSGYTITGYTSGSTPYKDWRTIVTKVDDVTAKTRFEYKQGEQYVFFSEETMKKRK